MKKLCIFIFCLLASLWGISQPLQGAERLSMPILALRAVKNLKNTQNNTSLRERLALLSTSLTNPRDIHLSQDITQLLNQLPKEVADCYGNQLRDWFNRAIQSPHDQIDTIELTASDEAKMCVSPQHSLSPIVDPTASWVAFGTLGFYDIAHNQEYDVSNEIEQGEKRVNGSFNLTGDHFLLITAKHWYLFTLTDGMWHLKQICAWNAIKYMSIDSSHLFNAHVIREQNAKQHFELPNEIIFSPCGNYFITKNEHKLYLWSIDGYLLLIDTIESGQVRWSVSGNYFTYNNWVVVLDSIKREVRQKKIFNDAVALGISSDESYIAVCLENGEIDLYDTQRLQGDPVRTTKIDGVREVQFSHDGKYLLYQLANGKLVVQSFDSFVICAEYTDVSGYYLDPKSNCLLLSCLDGIKIFPMQVDMKNPTIIIEYNEGHGFNFQEGGYIVTYTIPERSEQPNDIQDVSVNVSDKSMIASQEDYSAARDQQGLTGVVVTDHERSRHLIWNAGISKELFCETLQPQSRILISEIIDLINEYKSWPQESRFAVDVLNRTPEFMQGRVGTWWGDPLPKSEAE